jgi:hypothetical protein
MKDFRSIPLACVRDVFRTTDKRKLSTVAPGDLPASASVPNQPAIMEQAQTQSCTGHASTWAWTQMLRSRRLIEDNILLSPLYPWYFARAANGDAGNDTGVQLRDIMQAWRDHGSCLMEDWPEGSPIGEEPPLEVQRWGEAMELPDPERCPSLHEIKFSIAEQGLAVVIGLPVYEGWYSDAVTRSGIIPGDRATLGQIVGWHALAVCGYGDGRLTLANSWGESYGQKGFITVANEYLDLEASGNQPGFDAWGVGFASLPAA